MTILTPELTVPYQRPPLSKEFLRGEMDDDELPIEPAAWYAKHGVEVRLGAEAETLDPRDAHDRARLGETLQLRRLRARHRRRAGAAARSRARPRSGCCCCAASRPPACCATGAEAAKTAIVIGSGFIGCEAAASLAHARAAR